MFSELFINIHCLLEAGWRRRYVVFLPVIILPILGLLIGLLSPNRYMSYTSILVQEPAMLNPFLKDLAVETKLDKRITALGALLHSHHVLQKVAMDLGIINKKMSIRNRNKEISTLSKHLKLELVGKNLVKLHYYGENPKKMERILRAVSEAFITRILAPQMSSIESSELFLNKQIKIRRAALEKSEQALAKYKTDHADELPSLHDNRVKRLSRFRETLAQKKASLAGARAALLTLKSRIVQTDPVIGRLEEQIVKESSELVLLRAHYYDSHSKIQVVLRKVQRLKAERRRMFQNSSKLEAKEVDRLWQIATSVKTSPNAKVQPLLLSQLEKLQQAKTKVLSLVQEVKTLESHIKKLEPKVRSFGVNEKMLNTLKRDLRVKRLLYEKLLERQEMARVTGNLSRHEQAERVKVIDKPFVPITPINFPAIFYILAGIFGGLAIGIGFATVLELLDGSVRRRDKLEALLGVPVLSRIPPLTMSPE